MRSMTWIEERDSFSSSTAAGGLNVRIKRREFYIMKFGVTSEDRSRQCLRVNGCLRPRLCENVVSSRLERLVVAWIEYFVKPVLRGI